MAREFLLVGCGILRKEIRWLIDKNGWPLDTCFLDSSLHIDFGALERGLASALVSHAGRKKFVFYGCCHPRVESILEAAGTFRTAGQNCVEMLLGSAVFDEELSNGAFFLLEDWAWRWNEIMTRVFGTNREVIRNIFQEDRKYLLCLRTPCSRDFTAAAEAAGEQVGLPVRWRDVGLDHLEAVLRDAITRIRKEPPCPTR